MRTLLRVYAGDVPGLSNALNGALNGDHAVWPVMGSTPEVDDRTVVDSRIAVSVASDPAEVSDAVALVISSSGSTGSPKRVLLSAEALIASATATHDVLGGPGQWLLALPGHYIAGVQVLVRSLLAGTEPIVLPGSFDAKNFAERSAGLQKNVPHYTSLVPVQLARLLDAAQHDLFIAAALRSYDAILLGGQAAPPGLVERAQNLGANVVSTYGSTETAGGCVYDGVPLPGVRAQIVPESETALDVGIIELAGPTLALGYLADAARTDVTFTTKSGNRWYRTGDLGKIAETGKLEVIGRVDDVIISGGVKVSLADVQQAVQNVAGFAGALVIAVNDSEWGQRAAVLATEPARAANELELLALATDAAGLTPAGRPVAVMHVDRIPLLPSGKPDRLAIAALFS